MDSPRFLSTKEDHWPLVKSIPCCRSTYEKFKLITVMRFLHDHLTNVLELHTLGGGCSEIIFYPLHICWRTFVKIFKCLIISRLFSPKKYHIAKWVIIFIDIFIYYLINDWLCVCKLDISKDCYTFVNTMICCIWNASFHKEGQTVCLVLVMIYSGHGSDVISPTQYPPTSNTH